jgi:hypothetical protein
MCVALRSNPFRKLYRRFGSGSDLRKVSLRDLFEFSIDGLDLMSEALYLPLDPNNRCVSAFRARSFRNALYLADFFRFRQTDAGGRCLEGRHVANAAGRKAPICL